jgi:nicotinamidase-related amidase
VETAYGLRIPRTLDEACDPRRTALLVYDMQVGVVGQISDGAAITDRVGAVVDAARATGIRVVYTRHMFLPKEMSGVYALRTAMAWQHVNTVAEVRAALLPGSPGFELVPELDPMQSELVLDKITMSAFEGTPLDIVLRDCGIDTYVVVGVAMEVGIEPTVRHSLDLGYLPIVVTDACGHGNAAAASRSLDTLRFVGGTLCATTAELLAALHGAPA